MIISAALENGEDRVYVTQFASVAAYFTADDCDGGVILHIEPGFLADPVSFDRVARDVELSVLREVAVRLGIAPEDVPQQSFVSLKRIVDPALPDHYRYARRTKNRAIPTRF